MGLDMFLAKKKYISYDERENLKIEGVQVDPSKVKVITEEVGYWRKANAIHQWFVDHVQGGEDECRAHEVSVQQLQELLDLTNKVLEASELVDGEVSNGYSFENGVKTPLTEHGKVIKDPTVAEELLPTQSGFFFGSTDYDQYYLEDVKLTREILTDALKDVDPQDWRTSFEYQSSW